MKRIEKTQSRARKRVLVIEFSGGRTSALMAYILKKMWSDKHTALADFDEIIFVFMNTGLEDPETLVFAHKVDQAFGLGLIWIEADPKRKRHRKGEGFRIVTFETACRDKRIFNAVCALYGIPNKWAPHCTRELKQRPLNAYLRMFGHHYTFATGIRADEPQRLPKKREPGQTVFVRSKTRFMYPLAYLVPVTKAQVLNFWEKQDFDLTVPEHLGNCTFCHKKSLRKKLTIAADFPELVQPWDEMEKDHKDAGNGDYDKFNARDGLYVRDIIQLASEPFERFNPAKKLPYDARLDVESSCVCSVDSA